MPSTIQWRGDAPAVAQITTITLGGSVASGDEVTMTINSKVVTVVASSASLSALATALATAWNASDIAEFAEVTATADATVLTLTADTAGKPFTVAVAGKGEGQLSIVESTPGTSGTNEVQQFYFTPAPTGGFYSITFAGETTTPLSFSASAATVQAALIALATPVSGDITVTGSGTAASPFVLTFAGNYAATNVSQITVNATGLSGGGTVTVTTIREGSAFSQSAPLWSVTSPDEGIASWGLYAGGDDPVLIGEFDWNEDPANVTAAFVSAGYANYGVTVTGGPSQTTNHFAYYIHAANLTSAYDPAVNPILIVYGGELTVVSNGGLAPGYEYEVVNAGGASAGTFTLSDGVDTTSALAFNATGDTIAAEVLDDIAGVAEYEWVEGSSVLGVNLFRRAVSNLTALTIDTGSLTGTASVQTACNGGGAAVDELQRVYHNGTGGTLTLTFSGQTTAPIPFNASASQVRDALEALSNITASDLTVTGAGTSADPWYVTFGGSLSETNVAQLTGSGANLTGGITATISTTTAGSGPTDEVQTITISGASSGTFTLSFGGQTTDDIAYDAAASVVEDKLEALSTIGTGNVTVTGDAGGPYTVTFTSALGDQAVALLTGDNDDLVGTSLITATSATLVDSTGPAHADEPLNYVGGALPANGDTLVFLDSDADCLYGLDVLASVTLAELRIDASFTGAIGLPDYDEDGDYYQYRDRYLEVSASVVTIGGGDGPGSPRVKVDLKAVASEINVLSTGQPEALGRKAVALLGTHADNVLNVISGSVDIAPDPGAASTLATARISFVDNPASDSDVRFGDNVTLGTVLVQGGEVSISSDTTDLTVHDGAVTIWDGDHTSIALYGGELIYNSDGTITTLLVSNATANFARDPRPKTVTNPIQAFRGGTVIDPLGVLVAGGLEIVNNTGGLVYNPPAGLTLEASE